MTKTFFIIFSRFNRCEIPEENVEFSSSTVNDDIEGNAQGGNNDQMMMMSEVDLQQWGHAISHRRSNSGSNIESYRGLSPNLLLSSIEGPATSHSGDATSGGVLTSQLRSAAAVYGITIPDLPDWKRPGIQ
jgi:hypothetical protein